MSKDRRLRRQKYQLRAERAAKWDVEPQDDHFVKITVPSENGTTIKYLVRKEVAAS